MPKDEALFVSRREENASSLMPWASMAELAKKRMPCAFFLLWSSGTYSLPPLPSGNHLSTVHVHDSLSCLLLLDLYTTFE